MIDDALSDALTRLAQTPNLLVASDYDGTLAPIVENPSEARAAREALVALHMLASLANTHVAVISGRSLRELAELLERPGELHLVGSHGSEFDMGFASRMSDGQRARLQTVKAALEEIAQRDEGFLVEHKPASVAFHYRMADEAAAKQAISDVLTGPASTEGVHTRRGKSVIELSVIPTNKGIALERLRGRLGATAVLFLGDDVTDEDAFATILGPDVGVKVGEGTSIAEYRVAGPDDVGRLLAWLGEQRQEWQAGGAATPIEQHAMLSDQRTIALLTPEARITWLGFPRIDSPAMFAELLGGPTAGYFSVAAADDADPIGQEYINDTMVIRTRWQNFQVIDMLDCSAARPQRRPGRNDLIRIIEGTGRVRIEFAPRMDFGRLSTSIEPTEYGLITRGGAEIMTLFSRGVEWKIERQHMHDTAVAEIDLGDEPVNLELRYGGFAAASDAQRIYGRYQMTLDYWTTWSQRLLLPDIAQNAVLRSALILKALCFKPSGGIAAAGTTSLPEHIGGIRNWDYRFCWLRDSAMTASSLLKLGSTEEALHYLDWVLAVIEDSESPDRLMPLYDVAGKPLGAEADISELSGYRGSRPVRIGNAAAAQVQLDVFGPIADLIAQLVRFDAPLSATHWNLVDSLVTAVARRWHEPDHGIWEIRKPHRHHVHSKVMCWLTLDRAIEASSAFTGRDRPDWRELRQTIADDILTKGYKTKQRAFTAAYDGEDLDAAALWVGLSGLLPPDDERFANTVNAINRELRDGPTVYRYREDDGLPGHEGGFHICTAWLVDAFVLMGRLDEAQELFDAWTSLQGATGLLSEQYDPCEQVALGNVPQAYSHIGVIENAMRLDAATR